MSFPNKEERKKCWDSRDRYWECLDKHGDDQTKCVDCKAKYEVACPSQWVKHFDRKRNYLKFKDKIESDGYEPIDVNSDRFKNGAGRRSQSRANGSSNSPS